MKKDEMHNLPDGSVCLPYGPDAVLIRFSERVTEKAFEKARRWTQALEETPLPGLKEATPAFTSLLLEFEDADPDWQIARIRNFYQSLAANKNLDSPPPRVKEILVRYGGPDMRRVCELHGLTPSEVERIHSSTTYRVYALGFSPGFPYLGELDSRLHTPRLANPRPHVEAGSVAIGGEHTGVYSIASAGGWNIIGRTDEPLVNWNRLRSSSPASEIFQLRVGDQVRFVPVKGNAKP